MTPDSTPIKYTFCQNADGTHEVFVCGGLTFDQALEILKLAAQMVAAQRARVSDGSPQGEDAQRLSPQDNSAVPQGAALKHPDPTPSRQDGSDPVGAKE